MSETTRSTFGKADDRASYLIRLADGTSWEIGADDDAASRLKLYARILGLKRIRGGATRRLLLAGEKSSPVDLTAEEGWAVKDLRLLRLHYHQERSEVVCGLGPQGQQAEDLLKLKYSLFPIFEGVQEKGGIPFHAALIERDGAGILIAAYGGTGKTTCCRRIPPPWKPLCDDDTLVVKAGKDDYRAHPFPTWSRYIEGACQDTWDVQRSVPVRALFFLERAEEAEEAAVPLKTWEAAIRASRQESHILNCILLGLAQEECRKLRAAFFRSVADFVTGVPAYVLRAKLDGTFWKHIERVLA